MDARMLAPHGCVRLSLLVLSVTLAGCHHNGSPTLEPRYTWWRFNRPMGSECPTCPPNGAAYQPIGEYPIPESNPAQEPVYPTPAPPADSDAGPSSNLSLPPLSDNAGRVRISGGKSSGGPKLRRNIEQTQATSRAAEPRTLPQAQQRNKTVNEPVESQKKLVPPTPVQRLRPRELWNQMGKGYWYLIDVTRGNRPVKSPFEQKPSADQRTSANESSTSGGDNSSLAGELSKRIGPPPSRSGANARATGAAKESASASARPKSTSVAKNGGAAAAQQGKRVAPSRYAPAAQTASAQNKSGSAKRLTPIPDPAGTVARSTKRVIPDGAVAQSSASDAEVPLATALFDFTQAKSPQTEQSRGPVVTPLERRVTDAEIEPWPYTAQPKPVSIPPYTAQSKRFSAVPQPQQNSTPAAPQIGHTIPVGPVGR